MTTRNVLDLQCFQVCPSCARCANKGDWRRCPYQSTCSGRLCRSKAISPDPFDRDDYCRCKEGILQYRIQSGPKRGKMIIRKFLSDPFHTEVKTDAVSGDESDWNSYLQEQRERFNDELWDPVQFEDGSSTTDHFRLKRGGPGGI